MKISQWLKIIFLLVPLLLLTQPAYAGDPYGFYYHEYVKPIDTLNVRSGAGTSYSVVGTVPIGAPGEVLGGPTYNNGYHWWRIYYPVQGITGWCAQDWLALYNERDEADYSTGYVEVIGIGNLNTRIIAGVDQTILESYPEGTVGEVVGGPVHLDAYVWWRIAWPDGITGWSVQRYLSETTEPPQQDTVRPVITLNGSTSVTVAYGAVYSDAGATAYDNVDGNITGNMVTTGAGITTTNPGTYYVYYNVEDSAGNNAYQKTRTVVVQESGVPPVPIEQVIYADGFSSPWQNVVVENGAVVFESDIIKYEGASGLGISYSSAWKVAYFKHGSCNTTGFKTLAFSIYGPAGGGQNPIIWFSDANGVVQGSNLTVTDYVPGNVLLANTWHQVYIPLTDFGVENSVIDGIRIMSPTAPVGLYLDAFRLTSAEGTTYIGPTPTGDVSSTLFGNVLGSGWSTDANGATIALSTGHLDVSFSTSPRSLTFRSSGFDTTGDNTLSFYIKSSDANEQLYVHLHDANGTAVLSGRVHAPLYSPGEILYPGLWVEVHVPLADLDGDNRVITGVTFVHDDATIISLDEIRFSSFSENDTGGCVEVPEVPSSTVPAPTGFSFGLPE